MVMAVGRRAYKGGRSGGGLWRNKMEPCVFPSPTVWGYVSREHARSLLLSLAGNTDRRAFPLTIFHFLLSQAEMRGSGLVFGRQAASFMVGRAALSSAGEQKTCLACCSLPVHGSRTILPTRTPLRSPACSPSSHATSKSRQVLRPVSLPSFPLTDTAVPAPASRRSRCRARPGSLLTRSASTGIRRIPVRRKSDGPRASSSSQEARRNLSVASVPHSPA